MSYFHISFMEQNDIQKSAEVLSIAMLNNPHHIGVLLGNGENKRLETDLDENVRFYEKFGFKVISKSSIFKVENRYMLKTPQV